MELSVRIERWPLAGAFTISRGTKTEAVVVVAELSDGTHRGRGESVPYARYGETPDGIVAVIEALRPALRQGLERAALQRALAAGAARNALDCAYWDVNAKRSGRRACELDALVARQQRVAARAPRGRGCATMVGSCHSRVWAKTAVWAKASPVYDGFSAAMRIVTAAVEPPPGRFSTIT